MFASWRPAGPGGHAGVVAIFSGHGNCSGYLPIVIFDVDFVINRRLTAITSYLHFLSKSVYLVFGCFQFHSNVSASLDVVAAMINRGQHFSQISYLLMNEKKLVPNDRMWKYELVG